MGLSERQTVKNIMTPEGEASLGITRDSFINAFTSPGTRTLPGIEEQEGSQFADINRSAISQLNSLTKGRQQSTPEQMVSKMAQVNSMRQASLINAFVGSRNKMLGDIGNSFMQWYNSHRGIGKTRTKSNADEILPATVGSFMQGVGAGLGATSGTPESTPTGGWGVEPMTYQGGGGGSMWSSDYYGNLVENRPFDLNYDTGKLGTRRVYTPPVE